jgi:hypothetical protein
MVRAKFEVISIEEAMSDVDVGRVILQPVYDEDPNSENGKFFRYTPAGQIDLSTINPEALKQFEVGKEYYVDFTPAE